jgi:cytochrome c oxidase cbb3-type subunit 3
MPGINLYNKNYRNLPKVMTALAIALLITPLAMADGGGKAPVESSIYNPFVITMVVIMLILLLAIILLANVVTGAAGYYYEKEKEREQKESGSPTVTALSIIGLLLFSAPAFAQGTDATTTTVQTVSSFSGLSETAFYSIIGVISIELLVVFALLFQLRVFLQKEVLKRAAAGAGEYNRKPRVSLWNKLNKFRPVDKEMEIDLGHEYDGIRELDNRLPPWWLYGFYVSIIFAGIYLWRYHVTHTAPSSGEEYSIAMQKAEEQKALYLKKAANNVDENTVKLLTDAADLSNGQKVFTQNCAACHGKTGEGTVGPNLTDDYWLHGGSVKDIFKSIKYGWPEKGMRSWKEDLSPVQVSQVTSYIRSLHGTNPPNAKEKQGELYKEENSATTEPITNKIVAVTDK